MDKPLLTLKDGVILIMEDSSFEDGYCETCTSYGTRLDVTYCLNDSEKVERKWNLETDGAKVLTFVMRNMERIPQMTLQEFFSEIQNL